eukprot:Gb_26397 [translate_table: standard]
MRGERKMTCKGERLNNLANEIWGAWRRSEGTVAEAGASLNGCCDSTLSPSSRPPYVVWILLSPLRPQSLPHMDLKSVLTSLCQIFPWPSIDPDRAPKVEYAFQYK